MPAEVAELLCTLDQLESTLPPAPPAGDRPFTVELLDEFHQHLVGEPAPELPFGQLVYVGWLVDRARSAVDARLLHPVVAAATFLLDLRIIDPFGPATTAIAQLAAVELLRRAERPIALFVGTVALEGAEHDHAYQASADGWEYRANSPWPWVTYMTDQLIQHTAAITNQDPAALDPMRRSAPRQSANGDELTVTPNSQTANGEELTITPTITPTADGDNHGLVIDITPGTKQELVRDYVLHDAPNEFTIADVRTAVPRVSDQTIRLTLAKLKDADLVAVDGTGRSARWSLTAARNDLPEPASPA